MLSTALAIQEATKEAVHDEMVMDFAAHVYHSKDNISSEDFIHLLYRYSSLLSAVTATLVTSACLTESQLNEMIDSIKEMEALGEDINNGN